ncbi:hypothetical protein H0H92_015303 [Tricholoma furcatifolium]|nr:hypothetical protein H0H92_015303 [Tricholoma furcatifolium]
MASHSNPPTSAGPSLRVILKPQSSLVRYTLLMTVILSLSFSAVFGAFGIVVLKKIGKLPLTSATGDQLSDLEHIAVTFHIFVHLFFALFCFVGLYACLSRDRVATSLFVSFIMGQIIFSIGSGALCLYLLFDNSSSQLWNVENCLASASDNFARQLCKKTAFMKGISVAMFIVMWLVEIVTIFLANVYLSQLRDYEAQLDIFDPKDDIDGSPC